MNPVNGVNGLNGSNHGLNSAHSNSSVNSGVSQSVYINNVGPIFQCPTTHIYHHTTCNNQPAPPSVTTQFASIPALNMMQSITSSMQNTVNVDKQSQDTNHQGLILIPVGHMGHIQS